jgi:hypothetical protein
VKIPKGATHYFKTTSNAGTYYLMPTLDGVGVLIYSPRGVWDVWYSNSNMHKVIDKSRFDIKPVPLEMLMDAFIQAEEATEARRAKKLIALRKAEAKKERLAEAKASLNVYYKNPRSKW